MAGLFDGRQIPKCYDRLDKAREALFRCRSARDIGAFNSHWATLLISTGSILNALDAGAKLTPQARQWYGGKKREGRADELVSYMHQARNAEEHTADNVMAGVQMPFGFRNPETDVVDLEPGPGKNFVIGRGPTGFALQSVVDAYKQVFRPPQEHRGKPLRSNDPISVAELYIRYLDALIAEAATLA